MVGMGELRALADWWTGTYVDNGLTVATAAPEFTSVCRAAEEEHKMEPFLDVVDLRLAISLDQCLQTTTPLGRYNLIRDINDAIAIYRNTETLAPLNDLAIFTPLITTYRRPSVFIRGLSAHQKFANVWSWRDASSDMLEAAFTVLVATVKLDGSVAVTGSDATDGPVPVDEQQYFLSDPELVDLILGHKEKVDDIIGIVRTSPGISTELVRNMLAYEQQAIRDGLL